MMKYIMIEAVIFFILGFLVAIARDILILIFKCVKEILEFQLYLIDNKEYFYLLLTILFSPILIFIFYKTYKEMLNENVENFFIEEFINERYKENDQ